MAVGSGRSQQARAAAKDPQHEGTSQRKPFTQPHISGPTEPAKLMAILKEKVAEGKVNWIKLLAPVWGEEAGHTLVRTVACRLLLFLRALLL